jgi:hypothetical protein
MPLSVNVSQHSPHSNIWNTSVKLFLKHPVQRQCVHVINTKRYVRKRIYHDDIANI